MPWIGAAIIGLMIAALHYGRLLVRPNAAALLRAVAAAVVAAMLLGAPAGPSRPRPALVALDASASWTRGDRAAARWTRAVALARELAGSDTLWLFGDSLRPASPLSGAPADSRSSLGPVLDVARDERRPLAVVSDGEFTDAAVLPAGTRLTVIPAAPAPDAALASFTAPMRAAPGDTLVLRATLRAGPVAIVEATVAFAFAGGDSAVARTGPMAAFSERELSARLVAPRGEREQLLRATVVIAGDSESRNDSLATIVEITRVPSAVLVSSSPDPDARAALEALSGALVAPPRGYYLVAPGAWRDASTLRAVGAAEVRSAAAGAPLLVIHGDSLIVGPPSRLARGALVLLVPGDATETEWRASSADASPLSPSLAGIAWDSIPPIEIAASPPAGDWTGLSARSPGLAARAIVAGSETNGKRRVVVAAGGLWRWRARGGPPRDAFDALWGAIADWTTTAAVDARPALPARRWFRAEEPIGWIRSGADSVVDVELRSDRGAGDAPGRPLVLRFAGDARGTTAPALAPGRYTAAMRGGSVSFVVNAGSELLPARPIAHVIASGPAPGGLPAPPLRERWWAYVLAITALCGEWVIRRRAGLR